MFEMEKPGGLYNPLAFFYYGGFHPPNPPSGERPAATTERRGANFWRMPQRTAPYSLTTDDRYGFVKIPRGARVWGILSF